MTMYEVIAKEQMHKKTIFLHILSDHVQIENIQWVFLKILVSLTVKIIIFSENIPVVGP